MTSVRPSRVPFELLLLPWLIAAGWASFSANHWLESRAVEQTASGDVGPLPDGHTVRIASLGFARLAADLFWIRTVSYVGGEEAAKAKWPGAERLANLVTDIDPHYDSIYVLMASVLSGLRTDPDAAIRLLEKGAAVSSYWRIHFLLGFQYFMEKQDYVRGAESLQRAVALGGPQYLQFLVTRLYTSAGDPETGMRFIAARLQQEENPDVRAKLAKRFADLWINRDLGLINTAIAGHRAVHHRDPASVSELVTEGLLAKLPRDPNGGEYSIANGAAHSAMPYEVLLPHPTRGER
ncbi:MAG: tetratricopeptide repeat protein [Myxococcota bacterium]